MLITWHRTDAAGCFAMLRRGFAARLMRAEGGKAYCAVVAATGNGFTWMLTPLVSPLTMRGWEASA